MLKRIWQRTMKWFRRWFGLGRRQKSTLPIIHQQPPPPLTDTDYEFLFIQLLEGIAHGWQQARILRFFEVLSERGKQELWVAWLRRFGKRLLASPLPSNELAARMVQLGELGCGEIGEVAYEIGMQLLIRQTRTHWANTSVNGEDEREGDSQATEAAKVQAITLDELLVMLQQDVNIVQQVAQQLGIETTDPQVMIQKITNQLHISLKAEVWLDRGVQQYKAGDLLGAR